MIQNIGCISYPSDCKRKNMILQDCKATGVELLAWGIEVI